MLSVRYSSAFKKDLKVCAKRGYQMVLLAGVVNTLRIPAALPEKYRDHNLIGNYAGYRECHIEPDWLLIYKQTDDELQLARTGTHTDLFGK